MKNDQSPRLPPALRNRAINPSIRIVPIPRNGIPKHTRVSTALKVIYNRLIEQSVVQIPSTADWPEQPIRMGQFAYQLLGLSNFAYSNIEFSAKPERNRMRKRVIADPMTFRVSPRRKSTAEDVVELFSDDKERTLDLSIGEDVENLWRDFGFRTIVEGERYVEHQQTFY